MCSYTKKKYESILYIYEYAIVQKKLHFDCMAYVLKLLVWISEKTIDGNYVFNSKF